MEPEGSLPYSQEPAMCPFPESDQSSSRHGIRYFKTLTLVRPEVCCCVIFYVLTSSILDPEIFFNALSLNTWSVCMKLAVEPYEMCVICNDLHAIFKHSL